MEVSGVFREFLPQILPQNFTVMCIVNAVIVFGGNSVRITYPVVDNVMLSREHCLKVGLTTCPECMPKLGPRFDALPTEKPYQPLSPRSVGRITSAAEYILAVIAWSIV